MVSATCMASLLAVGAVGFRAAMAARFSPARRPGSAPERLAALDHDVAAREADVLEQAIVEAGEIVPLPRALHGAAGPVQGVPDDGKHAHAEAADESGCGHF